MVIAVLILVYFTCYIKQNSSVSPQHIVWDPKVFFLLDHATMAIENLEKYASLSVQTQTKKLHGCLVA